jgi:L-ascorbate metabolism protein UlaG (beta-lactamase superfamily)
VKRITFVGHATLLIELDGIRLLTDPLLTRVVGHLSRHAPVPVMNDWQLDAVLISHLHADHLHLPSLRLLGPNTFLIMPRGAGTYLARQGFNRFEEMEPGEIVNINGVPIEATVADHPGRPMPGRPDTSCIGYIIHASQHVYFTGDTDIFPEMASIGEKIDVALLPVWGWGPTLGIGHMNPFRAAKALELLRPTLAIPIHWGTYFPLGLRMFLPRFLNNPPREFAAHAHKLAPEVQVSILKPGESLELADFADSQQQDLVG